MGSAQYHPALQKQQLMVYEKDLCSIHENKHISYSKYSMSKSDKIVFPDTSTKAKITLVNLAKLDK
jgi:hypothetical protein